MSKIATSQLGCKTLRLNVILISVKCFSTFNLVQEVPAFHKRYFSHRDFMESEQMVCLRTLVHNGNYHIWRPPESTFQGKDQQQVYSPSLRIPVPEFRQWRELEFSRPVPNSMKFASPEGAKLVVERETV